VKPLWPQALTRLSSAEYQQLAKRWQNYWVGEASLSRLPDSLLQLSITVYLPLAVWLLAAKKQAPLVVGVNGAQGSGKSTLVTILLAMYRCLFAKHAVGFSIDDLYLTQAERQQLAQDVHPLLITRGVPGTHDCQLGMAILQHLIQASDQERTKIPVFNKAQDERAAEAEWQVVQGKPDIIFLEGWCVGARPQQQTALKTPVNALEALEDSEGAWRKFVNERLQQEYQQLFAMLDMQVMLKVPDFSCVYRWRMQQEEDLKYMNRGKAQHGIMDESQIKRFVMHYQRITESNLTEMPGRADVVLHLNQEHNVANVSYR